MRGTMMGESFSRAFKLRGMSFAAAVALPGLALAIVPNDPAKCFLHVGPGEVKTVSDKPTIESGEWYDIQGTLIAGAGSDITGRTSTNWLHGVSASQPAQIVRPSGGGRIGSGWDAVLACDGYLAQPAFDLNLGWDATWFYRVDVLPTALPVNAAGELQATNELMRFEAQGSQNFVSCYPIRNHGTRPVMLVSHGPDNWQPSCAGGFDMQDDKNHYSTVSGGEIILMSTRTPSGKLYPLTYYVKGATCAARVIPFPDASETGTLTIAGGAGLLVRDLQKFNFATVKLREAYDSGKIAWKTTGECKFVNVIARPDVDNALPYADDHVVTIGVSRDSTFDWSLVTNWALTNGCLDVNGKTAKVGRLYTENGAVVTNFTGTTGTLVFGDNGLESGFRGIATAGVVLRKTGAGVMKFGDSQIDALEVDAGSTGKLTSDGASAVVRVRSFTVAGVEQPTGVYSCATLPEAISGGLLVLVGDVEPIYWVGGESGSWQTAENWSSRTVPGSGDYLIFTNVVTSLTSEGDAEIDISPKGIVLDCRAGSGESTGVRADLTFAGSGCVYKLGLNMLRFGKAQKHSGGTVIASGFIYGDAGNMGTYGWGTGPITIDRRNGTDPYLLVYNPQHALTNEIRILGSFTDKKKHSICFSNDGGEQFGKITAEDDFTIKSGYCYSKYSRVYCDIDAPGKTLYVTEPGYGSHIRFTGNVNCSIDTVSAGEDTAANNYSRVVDVFFDGTNLCEDANLILRDFTNEFSRAAVWAGTNVVLKLRTKDGQPVTDRDGCVHTTALVLKGNQNLSPQATLHVDSNCRLDIDRGVKVSVKACFVNGVALEPGIYSASRRPDFIVGKGLLKVGNAGMLIIVR